MFAVAGHQLRHQVQPGSVDVPRGVAVIAADVILLGLCTVEQAAGLHEELLNMDVGRQAVAMQFGQEIQFRIVAENPLDEGFKEALLQTVAQGRTAQAQRGVDRQLPFGQLRDALEQRVDEVVGFAQTEGRPMWICAGNRAKTSSTACSIEHSCTI